MSKSKKDKQVIMELNIARINLLIASPLKFRIEWVRGNQHIVSSFNNDDDNLRFKQSADKDILD